MLDRGADVNFIQGSMLACPTDPDIDLKNQLGASILSRACLFGHTEVIRTLLNAGADANWHNPCGVSPLVVACLAECPHGAKYLLKMGLYYRQILSTDSTEQMINIRGHAEIIELLLDRGADIDKSVNGMSALSATSFYGQAESVKRLLDHGAHVNIIQDEDSPLCAAVLVGRTETLKLLLECRAQVGVSGGLPLFLATSMLHTETVEFVLREYVSLSLSNKLPSAMRSLPGLVDIMYECLSEMVITSNGER